ncbi:MAG: FeoB-associated Cys-rich membrane protein [Desulfopila sp.]
MLETLIVWSIIALCVFAVGRKFLRQFKNAAKNDGSSACGCDCSSCPSGKTPDKR